MKKLVAAAIAFAAFTGSAMAADLAPRPYSKAPAPVASAPSWTGFYAFGGFGGGLWAADSNALSYPSLVALTRDQRQGGSGWFGTVGVGYDWQFTGSWVVGLFGDGQFGSISGSLTDPWNFIEGREKLRDSYAAGARLGYLAAPNVLSYVNAGYSGSQWSSAGLSDLAAVGAGGAVVSTPSFSRNGWFVGGGVENSLNIFGIAAPGWFMKTEYRSAYYDRITLPETLVPGGPLMMLTRDAVTFKPWVQTISTSLVYRFNWSGPLVGKY